MVVFSFVLAAPGMSAAEPGRAPRVRIREAMAASAVRRAVDGARRRLQDAACRRVLTDFADHAGRPLTDALDKEGLTAGDYLAQLLFYDGSEQGVCDASGVTALTQPGSRVVLVCAQQFLREQKRSSVQAEYTVIHEMLHTLGLRERPPHPREIDARITARCGQ